MALLTALRPASTGSVYTPAAVAASDTIAATDLGALGAYLIVINGGGSPDVVTISDSGLTAAGNAATAQTVSVTNGTTKAIFIPPSGIHPTNLVKTIAHSFTTTVTCVLLPLG
jgi:hypothetical protein